MIDRVARCMVPVGDGEAREGGSHSCSFVLLFARPVAGLVRHLLLCYLPCCLLYRLFHMAHDDVQRALYGTIRKHLVMVGIVLLQPAGSTQQTRG